MTDIVKKIIRLGIGSMFIIAAILKLYSIDEFEIYIYSFNIINFITTTILSRFIITGELILGLFLIFNLYHKITWNATLLIECAFTLFLILTALFRDDSNCHCFGELIELSPIESIAKNIVTVALLFLIKNHHERKHKTLLPVIFCISSLIATFVVVPMDSVYNKIFSAEKEISTIDLYGSFDDLSKIDFTDKDITIDSTISFIPSDDKQLLVVVSSGCKYCQIGVKKLSLIVKNNDINPNKINIMIWGSKDGIMNFREMTHTQDFPYWRIEPHQAINITYGRFPMFIYIKGKDIIRTGDFRSINDNILL